MNDYGSAVSRVLNFQDTSFHTVVFQDGRPPLDSEVNLVSDLASETLRESNPSVSGFLMDPVDSRSHFGTNPLWSNKFTLPSLHAIVNGWQIRVEGTRINDTINQVSLASPPSTDARTDLVWLEVFKALVTSPPSTVNKPSSATLYRFGNTEYGGTNLTDDLEDPAIGYNTTKRVQIQYRIRVTNGVSLDAYPDGLDDSNVLARGTTSAPQAGFTFTNQYSNNDPGLWRAGDGDPDNALGTVDGYVYAIPIAAVFRRNGASFTAIAPISTNPNQNGSYNRNRQASLLPDSRSGAKTFVEATNAAPWTSSTTGVVSVSNLSSSMLGDSVYAAEVNGAGTAYLELRSGNEVEIAEISAISVGGSTITIARRGCAGTQAKAWNTASIRVYLNRPDGLYADQISVSDILDLRRSVNRGQWDYQRLLDSALNQVITNDLQTAFKVSGTGSDSKGVSVVDVSYMSASSAPNHTSLVDGFDGIRTTFSDASVLEYTTTLANPSATAVNQSVADFTDGVTWDGDPGFAPQGWINNPTQVWSNGSVVKFSLGGSTGSLGAYAGLTANGDPSIRFLTPKEYWLSRYGNVDQHPVTVSLQDQPITYPKSSVDSDSDPSRPGPMYPRPEANFEKPFVFLGGILNSTLRGSVSASSLSNVSSYGEIDLGINFDAAGVYYEAGNIYSTDPSTVSEPLLGGRRTLYDMLTNGGQDETGLSSEVYIVLYGDDGSIFNNGAFRVIGAGTASYTFSNATNGTSVVVEALSPGWIGFDDSTGGTITFEIRSQYTSHTDDRTETACLVWTDIDNVDGGESNPWNAANTSPLNIDTTGSNPSEEAMEIHTALQYGPSRSGFARVPDAVERVALRNTSTSYLRQPKATLDSAFATTTAYPSDIIEYPASHTSQDSSLTDGINDYANTQRDAEVFVDEGSKTLRIRPLQALAYQAYTIEACASTHLYGSSTYSDGPFTGTIDGLNIFTRSGEVNVAIPLPDSMIPKLGRQDIPYRQGTTTYLPGINHLFRDVPTTTDDVFSIIGGPRVTASGVRSLLFQTGSYYEYGESGTVDGLGNQTCYQARLVYIPTNLSDETGTPCWGIELPPYLGIARLYGVYERSNFAGNASVIANTIPGAFQSDRVTPLSSGPVNLLRTDAVFNTLYIRENGAQDVTGSEGDHTYVIPESAIDIRRIPTYSSGDTIQDFEYVVECVVFGFGRGFITENGYVLVRNLDGQNTLPALDSTLTLPLSIHAPVRPSHAAYTVNTRTVYQGDPYMTRDQSVMLSGDIGYRYGAVSVSDLFNSQIPIQQFQDGSMVVEAPNPRALRVLAMRDFWTTLGSGKIATTSESGTYTDVGYLPHLASVTSTTSPLDVVSRAFTYSKGLTHASTTLSVLNNLGAATIQLWVMTPDTEETLLTVILTAGTEAHQAEEIAFQINADDVVSQILFAEYVVGTNNLHIYAKQPGEEGNLIRLRVSFQVRTNGFVLGAALAFLPRTSLFQATVGTPRLTAYLTGGSSTNAYNTTVAPYVTGATERLPLGLRAQDADFLCESPSRDGLLLSVSDACAPFSGKTPTSYKEATVGSVLMMTDADNDVYAPYREAFPSGTRVFRTHRGSCVSVVDTDRMTAAPVRWNAAVNGEVNGRVLSGRAYLVQNQYEEAFASPLTRSYGAEIQLVVCTFTDTGGNISGMISPTGYGDGRASAERYLLEGRPMNKPAMTFDLSGVSLVPYRDDTSPEVDDGC